MYMRVYVYRQDFRSGVRLAYRDLAVRQSLPDVMNIVAIFYPFSQFCEINITLLSLHTQPNTAPNLFQRGVEYGKYDEFIEFQSQ